MVLIVELGFVHLMNIGIKTQDVKVPKLATMLILLICSPWILLKLLIINNRPTKHLVYLVYLGFLEGDVQ